MRSEAILRRMAKCLGRGRDPVGSGTMLATETKGAAMNPVWTKSRVIEAIRARQQAGLPVRGFSRQDPRLYFGARRLFGSWECALQAAGLPSRPLRKWSRSVVTDEILARHQAGLPLAKITILDNRLYNAARRLFGSWNAALVAAGLPPNRKWSIPKILDAIRSRHEQGRSLSSNHPDNRTLFATAQKYFGTWHAAFAAAGIPSKPRKLWSRERILQELRDGYQRGLRARKAFDRRLVEAARLRFGNWPQALSAAGLPLPKRRRWTAQAVLDALKARHQQGLPMGRIWKEDSGLCCAMKSHFGGMSAALKILGLSLNRRTWTRQDVLDRLRSHLESGAPPSAVWRDRKLTAAATAHFGGRVAAWRAVGVEIEIPPKWTKASILETLRSRYQQGLPMTTRSHPLNSAARRLFGSWNEALEAAGIRIKGCWCRQRVLAELQSASDEGRSRGPYLHAAARRYFGSMKAAVAAAGLDPDERKWSRELVIEAIQDRHVQGLSLSSGRCREGGLAPAARRYFGGWRSALAAAGIKREPIS